MAFTADEARRLAADPATDPATLYQLAQEHAEVLPALAAHPNTYPDLLAWLEGLRIPEVDAALAARPLPSPGPSPSPTPEPTSQPDSSPAPHSATTEPTSQPESPLPSHSPVGPGSADEGGPAPGETVAMPTPVGPSADSAAAESSSPDGAPEAVTSSAPETEAFPTPSSEPVTAPSQGTVPSPELAAAATAADAGDAPSWGEIIGDPDAPEQFGPAQPAPTSGTPPRTSIVQRPSGGPRVSPSTGAGIAGAGIAGAGMAGAAGAAGAGAGAGAAGGSSASAGSGGVTQPMAYPPQAQSGYSVGQAGQYPGAPSGAQYPGAASAGQYSQYGQAGQYQGGVAGGSQGSSSYGPGGQYPGTAASGAQYPGAASGAQYPGAASAAQYPAAASGSGYPQYGQASQYPGGAGGASQVASSYVEEGERERGVPAAAWIAVGIGLALLVGAIVWFVTQVLGGDDDPVVGPPATPTAEAVETPTPESVEPTPEPEPTEVETTPEVDPVEQLEADFAALQDEVRATASASECTDVAADSDPMIRLAGMAGELGEGGLSGADLTIREALETLQARCNAGWAVRVAESVAESSPGLAQLEARDWVIPIAPVPGDARAATEFMSPSENIVCNITGSTARCTIHQYNFTPAGNCSPGSPVTFVVDEEGARLDCSTQASRSGTILGYGSSAATDRFFCISRESGMYCTDSYSGAGFEVARSKQVLNDQSIGFREAG